MSTSTRWRPLLAFVALALLSAVVVFVAAERSSAEDTTLPSADKIVLELEPGTNQVVYGPSEQLFTPDPTSCNVTTTGDAILVFETTATDKKGDPVEPAKLGLVDDGLGSNEKGNGNGQDCGRVGAGESLTITLAEGVGSKAIQNVDWHFEGKFGGSVDVTYHVLGGDDFTENYVLSDNGSDSGPDAKLGDDYRYNNAPGNAAHGDYAANAGKLFTGVTITAADDGEVALKGGIWPEDDYGDGVVDPLDRTVFHLVDALDCGDSAYNGGPDEMDTPWAAFYLGPPKVGEPPCAVTIDLTTSLTEVSAGGVDYQSVTLEPTEGTTWDGLGVTGVLTIEWDAVPIDPPGEDEVARTSLVIDIETATFETIPWCNEEIPLLARTLEGQTQYILDYDPDNDPPGTALYNNATNFGPEDVRQACLIFQNTTTVDLATTSSTSTSSTLAPMYIITTEAFYIWDDPSFSRPR